MRVRTEAKREAILKAASQVFLESGFEARPWPRSRPAWAAPKATLYGYFPSKEDLLRRGDAQRGPASFRTHLRGAGERQRVPALALQNFGERMLAVLCQEPAVQARRAIIAESGRSDIGVRFYEGGPRRVRPSSAASWHCRWKRASCGTGDPLVAAHHLMALLDSETITPSLLRHREKADEGVHQGGRGPGARDLPRRLSAIRRAGDGEP